MCYTLLTKEGGDLLASKYTRQSRAYMNSFNSTDIDIDAVTDELEKEVAITSDKKDRYVRNQSKVYIEAEKNKLTLEDDEMKLKSCNSFSKEDEHDYIELKNKTSQQTERLNNSDNDIKSKPSHGDSYVNLLNKIINNLEEVYGLRKLLHGVPVMDLGIDDVRQTILPKLSKNNKELNGTAGKYIVELSYLSDRLEFFGYDRVDFKCYKFLETILPILFSFSTAERVRSLGTSNGIKDVTKVFIVLKMAEDDNKKFIKALGYRLLRLFAILVYHNNIVDAGIIAKFILLQMALSDVRGAKERRSINQHNISTREQQYKRNVSSYKRDGYSREIKNNERSKGKYRRSNPRMDAGHYRLDAFQ